MNVGYDSHHPWKMSVAARAWLSQADSPRICIIRHACTIIFVFLSSFNCLYFCNSNWKEPLQSGVGAKKISPLMLYSVQSILNYYSNRNIDIQRAGPCELEKTTGLVEMHSKELLNGGIAQSHQARIPDFAGPSCIGTKLSWWGNLILTTAWQRRW